MIPFGQISYTYTIFRVPRSYLGPEILHHESLPARDVALYGTEFCSEVCEVLIPYHVWYIYLHEWLIFMV